MPLRTARNRFYEVLFIKKWSYLTTKLTNFQTGFWPCWQPNISKYIYNEIISKFYQQYWVASFGNIGPSIIGWFLINSQIQLPSQGHSSHFASWVHLLTERQFSTLSNKYSLLKLNYLPFKRIRNSELTLVCLFDRWYSKEQKRQRATCSAPDMDLWSLGKYPPFFFMGISIFIWVHRHSFQLVFQNFQMDIHQIVNKIRCNCL